jgi:hypothetical protein
VIAWERGEEKKESTSPEASRLRFAQSRRDQPISADTIELPMTARYECDPAALRGRLWFPGPASPYSPEQRRAIRRLVARHVERVCAASRRPCGDR